MPNNWRQDCLHTSHVCSHLFPGLCCTFITRGCWQEQHHSLITGSEWTIGFLQGHEWGVWTHEGQNQKPVEPSWVFSPIYLLKQEACWKELLCRTLMSVLSSSHLASKEASQGSFTSFPGVTSSMQDYTVDKCQVEGLCVSNMAERIWLLAETEIVPILKKVCLVCVFFPGNLFCVTMTFQHFLNEASVLKRS